MSKLEKVTTGDDFWNNQENAQNTLKKLSGLKDSIEIYRGLKGDYGDLKELFDLTVGEDDPESVSEIEKEVVILLKKVESLELDLMLDGEDDDKNAILTIHPGAGGTESQDWAEMLMRMYLRWFELRGFKSEVLDLQNADEAGIKSVSIEIKGKNIYGYAKAEIGVHRLVRISPFDTNRRRHTSFASVFVYPDISDNISIEVSPKDIRIDTFRASGAGGQHVNKTDSAVRITHLETRIVVSCQSQRSQHKNKENALKILKSRLYTQKREEEEAKIGELEKSKTEIGWGNQIRSYILHPYNMVKDHRTSVETGNVQAVLGGELDNFVTAYLLLRKEKSS